jgi:intracellular septation protein
MLKKNKHIIKLLIFDMFVIEFGPVGVFFITYYLTDFLTAALALSISTFLTMLVSRFVNKRVPWFAIFSGIITIISALVTYLYNAPWILIVHDTVYYLIFVMLLGFSMWKKSSIFKTFFGHVFAMSNAGWRILEMRWFFFFLFAAISNEAVRVFLTPDEWVFYKQIMLIIFLVFGMYQFRVSAKYRLESADKFGLRKIREDAQIA